MDSQRRKRIIERLREKFGDVCQNCGVKCDDTDYIELPRKHEWDVNRRLGGSYPTVEHVWPAVLGGTYCENNLLLYCNDCNWNMGQLFEFYNGFNRRRGQNVVSK